MEIKPLIKVEEKEHRHLSIDGDKEVSRFTYHAETFWSSTGFVTLSQDIRGEWKLSWVGGGTNEGYSQEQIASTLATGFAMAQERLRTLEKEQGHE